MIDFEKHGNKLRDLQEISVYLKSELHNAVHQGNIISTRYYYDLITDVEQQKIPLIEEIDEYCQFN